LRARQATYESTRESKKGLEKGVESGGNVLESSLSLQTTTVEANVPVGQLVDEVEHLGDDGVEAVGCERGREESVPRFSR
jgi:hypothetical protein